MLWVLMAGPHCPWCGPDKPAGTGPSQAAVQRQHGWVCRPCLVSAAPPCHRPTGLVSSGQLPKTVAFLTKHPEALGAIMLLSCASSCGEYRTPTGWVARRRCSRLCAIRVSCALPSPQCSSSSQPCQSPRSMGCYQAAAAGRSCAGNCAPCVSPCCVGAVCPACREPVHLVHHQELWRACVCDHHDHAAVPLHTAVVVVLRQPPHPRTMVSVAGLLVLLSVCHPCLDCTGCTGDLMPASASTRSLLLCWT